MMALNKEQYPDDLRAADCELLMDIACRSIQYGVKNGEPLPVKTEDYPVEVRKKGASFVTLTIASRLRGCIGTLEAHRPLIRDVAVNAYHAGFDDPRFSPLQAEELAHLELHISVLNPATPMACSGESELITILRPGIDGVIIQEGSRRATFLPSVWDSLPDPTDFIAHLKLKAGLPTDYWSPTIEVFRYTCQSFGRPFLEAASDRAG